MYAELVYHCDFCGYAGTKAEVMRHEAQHFGLTVEQYEEWRLLDKKVKMASHLCEDCHNERTLKALDEAVEAVLAFEKEHNLQGRSISAG